MSSVQSFLRQRVTGSTILLGPTITGASTNQYFTFVAASGNYVGNYPPGTMVDATANVFGLETVYGTTGAGAQLLRDMGKTIKASVAVGATLGTPGFFREVQLLVPSTVASATASTNNGVIGQLPGSLPSSGNAGDAGYATFYIPIAVGGVVPGTAATPSLPLSISTAGVKVGEQL